MWRILVIVDRTHIRNQIKRALSEKDREILFTETIDNALWHLNSETIHVIIADEDVIENESDRISSALQREEGRLLPIILLTNYRKGHTRFQLEGVSNWNLLKKPINADILKTTVSGLLQQVRYPNVINYLRHKEKYIYRLSNIIAASPGMKSVMNLVKKVAGSNSSVLITGEKGTGKEMIAAAIHFNSARKKENFVSIPCSALSDNQIESELFGHEKGAIPNAEMRRIGRIEQANAGSLFLKEVGKLRLTTQAKVLRVFQQGEFERLGGTQKVKVDVRILCSSSQDLRQCIDEGIFREDLYYRINVIQIHIPPLRERKEDVPALALFFLHKYRRQLDRQDADFSPKAIEMMMEYEWPGNVRELENVVERSLFLSPGGVIEPDNLVLVRTNGPAPKPREGMENENLNLEQLERSAIVEALTRAKGVQKEAARILGISPRVIHYKIQKHNIQT